MDELTAYILIQEHPYEITLNLKPLKPNKLVKVIIESISKEIGKDVEFKLIYAKYKYLRFRNMELYCFFKSRYFREEILKQQKELLQIFGLKKYMMVQMEIYEEITEEFDNILKKYNFEKG